MKAYQGLLIVGIAILAVTLLSCASLKQPPDPAQIQAQIAEAREQEIELVRATVADPGRAELGAAIDDVAIGGLGLHLITALTDRQSYRRVDGCNILRVTKMLEPAEE